MPCLNYNEPETLRNVSLTQSLNTLFFTFSPPPFHINTPQHPNRFPRSSAYVLSSPFSPHYSSLHQTQGKMSSETTAYLELLRKENEDFLSRGEQLWVMTNGQMLNLHNRLLSSGYGPNYPLHFVLKGGGCDFSSYRYFSLPLELLRCATANSINETMHIELQLHQTLQYSK